MTFVDSQAQKGKSGLTDGSVQLLRWCGKQPWLRARPDLFIPLSPRSDLHHGPELSARRVKGSGGPGQELAGSEDALRWHYTACHITENVYWL